MFWIGLLIGGTVGFLITALFVGARRGDINGDN